MSFINIPTSFGIDLSLEIAPIHYRLAAFIIDKFLLVCYSFLVFWGLYDVLDALNINEVIIYILLLLPVFFYSLILESKNNGATIGKKLMNLKVMSMDGKQASFYQYLLRWMMEYIDFTFLTFFLGGFLSMAVTKHSQRLGDLAAGTIVVMRKIDFDIDNTIFQNLDFENYVPKFPSVMRITDHDINAIHSVLNNPFLNHERLNKTATVVKDFLKIETDLDDYIFLETLLTDYNFLSRKDDTPI